MAQARTHTVSLGEHWNSLIESMIISGRYESMSEDEESVDAGELDMETIRLEAKKEADLI